MSNRRRGANSAKGKGVGVQKLNANKNKPEGERGLLSHDSDSEDETAVYLCQLCNENVNEEDKTVECNWGKNREHTKCAGLPRRRI